MAGEETAAQRKQRLMAIRAAARNEEAGEEPAEKRARLNDHVADEAEDESSAFRFRNYKPVSDELKGISTDAVSAPVHLGVAGEKKGRHDDAPVVELVDRTELEELEANMDVSDLSKLAPKKATWDLDRLLEPKLEILKSRTQRAVIDLLREKLAQNPAGIVVTQNE
eukprot:c1430_g1_i1.p1 GENE.c1430_g1_i1~~c1430_g1_i1.p1  ORF type:complete len:185 (+),score=27.89 c1430_g1_i1:55-555(+)